MQEQGLHCLPKQRFAVTTDNNYSNPVFKDLLKDRELTEPDQIWHADITYLSLPNGFA